MDIRRYLKDTWDDVSRDSRSEPESRASLRVYCKSDSRNAVLPRPMYEASNHKRRSRGRAMRTVSEDDELVQRAANPRTGIITPFINITSIKEDANSDYLAAVSKCEPKTPPLVRLARKAVGSGLKPRKHGESPPTKEEVVLSPPIKPSASMRLSQYLPKLEFLHPSHFANLEQSYRRPAHLLPPNLRKKQQQALSKRSFSGGKARERAPMQTLDGNENVSQGPLEEDACELRGRRQTRAKFRSSPSCHCPTCLGPKQITKQSRNETIISLVGYPASRDSETGTHEVRSKAGTDHSTYDFIPAKSMLTRLDMMTTRPLTNTGWIQERMLGMISHILTTLHRGSPALKVLRSQDARFDEYARALRQVFLAGLYTLVLLNIFMLVVRAVRLALKLLAVIGWPLKMVCSVLGWVFRA